jgi:hypothetical protein
MRYASIDIETTGIDPDLNQILSIGIILEDSNNPLPYEELPKFHCAIKRTELYGNVFAINMNKDLIETINSYNITKNQDERNDIINSSKMQFFDEKDVVRQIFYFMYDNDFLEKPNTDSWNQAQVSDYFETYNGKLYPILKSSLPAYQIVCAGKNFATFDKLFLQKLPGWKQVFGVSQRVLDPGILYVDWKNDKVVPNMITCKERGNVPGVVTHNALEDAWDVVQLLRNKY